MATDLSDFTEIYHTSTEAEALMYQDLLKQNGIAAEVKLPGTQQFLRANAGGGANPFNVWLVLVPAASVEAAREILPSQPKHPRKLNKQQKIYRGWIILGLIAFLILFLYSFIDMIKSIFLI